MLKGPTQKYVQPAFALIQVLTGSDNSHGSYDGRTVLFLAAMLCSLYTTSYTSVVHKVTFAERDPNLLMLLFNLFNCFIRIFLKSRL